ncbi:SDR family oxidoreductase [Modestobacter sp. I12A-02628]|uniref:SDR family oxidoreductase n=1 Tax=Goekera deserti TaxID=2497753 RepID=A0A7K3WFX8_9ACTN|nr:SDR family oxidoreductase [Goekera deserti]MPQ96851.1 SDR family oxidoreductase [Goekera deserti]NDI46835.1 SDR family oxidoreductase [Goekera deserti]NEL54403.1 SDR family oxidoreductase [Goekera deserti]
MDLGLGGRGYLLTGASRGLGLATARALVDDGARVLVSSRSQSSVEAAVASLGGAPAAHGHAADLAEPAAATDLVAAAGSRLDRLDGALVSVGGPAPGSVLEVAEESWRAAVDSVLLGTIRLVKALVPVLGEGAAIGLVLSSSVRQPIGHLAISNGLRPGLAMTAKALADELGPRGIRVFGLLPGTIATDRITEIEAASGDAAAMRARTEAGIPLRRVGRPEEFGRVAAFALSPAASYLTGVMLPVDGGALRAL